MSTSSSSSDQSPAKRDKRGHVTKPGLSVLAQGEPMIWLSGGALALSLVMIFGLLGLVIYQGMATFWPGNVYRMELVDDSIQMGEETNRESFNLSIDNLDSLSEQAAERARVAIAEAGGESVVTKRKQYRTGNFDLTNTHFHWINQFELKPDQPTTPEWALVVERVEWGRFYGEPTRFSLTHWRTISAEEEQLAEIQRFFEVNAYRLDELVPPDEPIEEPADAAPEDAQEDQTEPEAEEPAADAEPRQPTPREQYAAEIEALTEQLTQVRAENVEAFLEEQADSEHRKIAILDNGQELEWEAIEGEPNVLRLREITEGPAQSWAEFQRYHDEVRGRFYEIKRIEKHEVGEVSLRQEEARLSIRRQELAHRILIEPSATELYNLRVQAEAVLAERARDEAIAAQVKKRFGDDSRLALLAEGYLRAIIVQQEELLEELQARRLEIEKLLEGIPPAAWAAIEHYIETRLEVDERTLELNHRIEDLRDQNERIRLIATTAQGIEKELALGDIVRAFPANQLTTLGRLGVYGSRWREFLLDDPREANAEGGVFPAIWGTVAMTMIMSLIVVPFGVLAALYLREYAKPGTVVSAIRISINNLAGVPSIVFGVFGYGFLIFVLGAYIDGGPANAGLPIMPPLWWWGMMTLLAVVAVAAFLLSVYSLGMRRKMTARRSQWVSSVTLLTWVIATGIFVTVLATTPYFGGFYQAGLPNPTFGKGALIWASLTLALLTLPVVIVATEEALSAVPNSLREGSYGCGASKWQTLKRIVLPHAMPGIMTGMILAMARGAGEVAPLMLVGVLKLAPELPVDLTPPFVHLDRSFMHLGFHIFDLGFQSPNSEAAKPMVFTTTLLLIGVIALLNLTAIWLRARLRKQFQSGQF
ncbi:MAG: ABC transporter permease subunit [Pirellulaceae bacterium]